MTNSEELKVQETINKADTVRQELGIFADRWNNAEQSVSEEMFNDTKEKFSKLLTDFVTDFSYTSLSIARIISQLKVILESILPVLEYDNKHGWLALRNIMMFQVDSLLRGIVQDLEQNDVIKNTESDVLDVLNEKSLEEVLKSVYDEVGKNQFDMLNVIKALYKEMEHCDVKIWDSIGLALQNLEENYVLNTTRTSWTIVNIMKKYNEIEHPIGFIEFLDKEIQEAITLFDLVEKLVKTYSNEQVIEFLLKCGRIREKVLADYPELQNADYQFQFGPPTLIRYGDCLEMVVMNKEKSRINTYRMDGKWYKAGPRG